MPRVSVIIPTYNRADLLQRAMESVLGQTYAPCELVIVDDGSTDDTEARVARFVERIGSSKTPIRYIRQKQQGAPVARNTGVLAATGEWIAFLDSDDRWLKQKLELQVAALRRFEKVSDACVTDASYFNNPELGMTAFQQAGTQCDMAVGMFPEIIKRIAYGYHGMYLQTLMVRRQLLVDIGGFDPSLPLGDDTDLLFQIASRTIISYVNIPLVEIDRTPNRSTGLIELSRKEKLSLELSQYLYEKWLGQALPLSRDIRKRIQWRLQEVHTGLASWYLLNGNYVDAVKSMSVAICYQFTGRVGIKLLLTAVAPGLARSVILRRRARMSPQVLF